MCRVKIPIKHRSMWSCQRVRVACYCLLLEEQELENWFYFVLLIWLLFPKWYVHTSSNILWSTLDQADILKHITGLILDLLTCRSATSVAFFSCAHRWELRELTEWGEASAFCLSGSGLELSRWRGFPCAWWNWDEYYQFAFVLNICLRKL